MFVCVCFAFLLIKIITAFSGELQINSVPLYRYNLSESVFERVTNGTDCYDTIPTLPTGVSDASRCYFGMLHPF